MIVHIFPYEKFTLDFMQFIKNNFQADGHLFILCGGDKKYFNEKEINGIHVIDFERNPVESLLNITHAKVVIAHSIFFKTNLLTFLTFFPRIQKKVGWVCWGGELEFLKKNGFSGMKLRIRKMLMIKFIKRIKAVIVLAPKDYDKVEKIIDMKKNFFFIPSYGNGRILNLLEKIDQNTEKNLKKDNTTKILIGNSSTPTNNHFEVFDMLERFKGESIRIFCPLSYGDEEYKKKVIQIGKQKFGDKFIPLIDFMAYEEYIELLSSMDIAVFNNNRQQALGNIRILLYFGCKVYLRPDTSMGEVFFREFDVFPISEIEHISFLELKKILKVSVDKNKKEVINIHDENKLAIKWNEIFSYLSANKEGKYEK